MSSCKDAIWQTIQVSIQTAHYHCGHPFVHFAHMFQDQITRLLIESQWPLGEVVTAAPFCFLDGVLRLLKNIIP